MIKLHSVITHFLQSLNISDIVFPYIAFITYLVVAIVMAIVCVYITRLLLKKIIAKIIQKSKTQWDNYIFGPKVYNALSLIIGVVVLRNTFPVFYSDMPTVHKTLSGIVDLYLIYIITNIVILVLRTLQEKLSGLEAFKDKPLYSYFQLVKILLIIAALIFAFSILVGKSPLYLLSAFGAMTAVILLIFKDTILGLVASVQISAYDMVRIGDWVSMPKFNADGDVVSISLNTVKIVNWDKTVSTVPTYYFVTESFRNWRAMQESGGRRIKRTLRIDVGSVCFVDKKMLDKFKKVDLIGDFIHKKQQEIEAYNQKNSVDTSVLINGRRMTNIGVFRQYAQFYLEQHPGVHNPSDNPAMYQLVRQLTSDEHGIPLQVWCYTKTVRWAEYEPIQSDIFDHLFAATSFFGLSIYQSPSGKDLRSLKEESI